MPDDGDPPHSENFSDPFRDRSGVEDAIHFGFGEVAQFFLVPGFGEVGIAS